MNLEERAHERIAKEFSAADRAAVCDLLSDYAGPEAGRVVWDILELSQGDAKKLLDYLTVAHTDYRDVLYWAEYYDTDPMLKGRDPKKMVEGILSKWGTIGSNENEL